MGQADIEFIQSRVEVERFIDAGEHVVVIGRTHGTVRATGSAFDVPVAHVWEVRGGRLLRFQPYIDNAKCSRRFTPERVFGRVRVGEYVGLRSKPHPQHLLGETQ